MLTYVLPVLLNLLAEEGITRRQLLENSGLEDLDLTAPHQLSDQQSDDICSRALELSDDSLLGMKLGVRLNMVSLGILGYALMTSATVGDALKLLLRYKRAVLPGMRIELMPCDGSIELRSSADHLPRTLERFYQDALYAGVVTNLGALTNNHLRKPILEVNYPLLQGLPFYQSIFGLGIELNASRYGLIFDSESLAVAISTSDPQAQDIFRRECDRIIAIDNPVGMVSERVKQALLGAQSDFPSSAMIAKQMYMSESTLQRRLAAEGVRYQELLDQVRHRLAIEYLQGTQLPIAEITQLLGFSNPANFRRAFKRWSAKSPSEVREKSTL